MRKPLYKYTFLSVFLLLFWFSTYGQKTQSFRVKKPEGDLIFYQKGQKSDSLRSNEKQFFVMIIPEGLKKFVSISLTNAQLVKTDNDSIFQLKFMKGMSYENHYSLISEKNKQTKWEFLNLVNGAAAFPSTSAKITFTDTRDNTGVLLENEFYFKE